MTIYNKAKSLGFAPAALTIALAFGLMAIFGYSVSGVDAQQAPKEIEITHINDVAGPGFGFSCPDNPLSGPITVEGDGSGAPPPGQWNQYQVQVLWGDDTSSDAVGDFTAADPEDNGSSFTFTFDATHEYTVPGEYTITAKLYHQTPPGKDGPAESFFSVEICVDPDPDETGTIIVEKVVSGSDSDQLFDFTSDWGSFSLSDGQSTSTVQVLGDYSVSEDVPDEWQLDSAECVYEGGATSTPSNIVLDEDGEVVTCTFTNSETPPGNGTIRVRKQVEEGDDTSQQFLLEFSGNWNVGPQFFTHSENYPIERSLAPNEDYTITETVPGGWELVSISCDVEGQSGIATTTNSVTVSLTEDDDVSCTFLNRETERTGDVVVIKEVINDDQTGTSTVEDFTLFVGDTEVESGATTTVLIGTYQVTETGPSGYNASFGGDCDSEGNVTVSEEGTAVCTITNNDIPDQPTGDDDDDSSSSGGGGGSSRRDTGDDDNDGEVLGATAGEVLQAQTTTIPAGAPATGFGGMAAGGANGLGAILSLLGGLALFAGKKND